MLVNMNDVLLPAKKGGYGVGFFNAVNVDIGDIMEFMPEINLKD